MKTSNWVLALGCVERLSLRSCQRTHNIITVTFQDISELKGFNTVEHSFNVTKGDSINRVVINESRCK